MTGLVISERCQGPCGRYVAPSKLLPRGPYVKICEDCHARHEEALEMMVASRPPKACQSCRRSLDELKSLHRTGEPSFVVHLLDGMYVALCERCDVEVQRLSRHMYRDTPHGKAHNLQ